MVVPNGIVGGLPGARQPLKVNPQTIAYPIERVDGETVVLAGYVKGPGCPITVAIDVDDAWARWSEDIPTPEETGTPATDDTPAVPGTLSPHRYHAKLHRADRMLRRDLLRAVIPGLTSFGEDIVTDVLAADDGPWEMILVELGWWIALTDAEVDPGPEAPSGASTGGPDSPASPTTTAPRIGPA